MRNKEDILEKGPRSKNKDKQALAAAINATLLKAFSPSLRHPQDHHLSPSRLECAQPAAAAPPAAAVLVEQTHTAIGQTTIRH
jgi:hypothetical protein